MYVERSFIWNLDTAENIIFYKTSYLYFENIFFWKTKIYTHYTRKIEYLFNKLKEQTSLFLRLHREDKEYESTV
jgi:hypothetical protein